MTGKKYLRKRELEVYFNEFSDKKSLKQKVDFRSPKGEQENYSYQSSIKDKTTRDLDAGHSPPFKEGITTKQLYSMYIVRETQSN